MIDGGLFTAPGAEGGGFLAVVIDDVVAVETRRARAADAVLRADPDESFLVRATPGSSIPSVVSGFAEGFSLRTESPEDGRVTANVRGVAGATVDAGGFRSVEAEERTEATDGASDLGFPAAGEGRTALMVCLEVEG